MRTSRNIILGAACFGVLSAGWVAGHPGPDRQEADAAVAASDTGSPGTVVADPPAASSEAADQASPTASATNEPEASLADGTFTGAVISNDRGQFEASITITDGVITDVTILRQGTQEAQSQRINAMAGPQLVERILAAQTWQVEAVSGASYSSDGVTASVRDALAQAGAA